MSFLDALFGAKSGRARLRPLYSALVAAGRDPAWYRDGQVPDTLDGRFDTIAAILALVLLRLEREGEAARRDSVLLTEAFIDDMDGTLRQIGIGDFVVGKHIGKMMGALGGRLAAFREAISTGSWEQAVRRNLFRDAPPSPEAVTWVAKRLQRFREALEGVSRDDLIAGRLPAP